MKGGAHVQIGHGPLALLIAAQAAVLAPHALRISVWVTAVALFAALWRVGIYYGRLSHPPLLVKLGLVIGGAAAVLAAAESAFSVQPAVDLLIVAGALKLIEMANRRDAFVVILVAWFVAAAVFLFDQDILTTAYMGLAVTVVTAALIGLSQSESRQRPLRTLRTAGVMTLQAVPLALLVFLFFPRVAPLWSVPAPGGGKTGLAEVIEPGAIATLSNSSELAFRVAFEGAVPPRPQLYWRGLVYSRFEDGRWSQAQMPRNAGYFALNGGRNASWRNAVQDNVEPVRYDVVMEPTRRNWLFALGVPVQGSARTVLLRDWRLASLAQIGSKFSYSAVSRPGATIDVDLPDWFRRANLDLPAGESPRARDLAMQMRAAAGSAAAFVGTVLRMYRDGGFVYTLAPGTLPRRDSIDAFVFDTRRGFCSHFAGSFVFMMRAGGVPARMIGGYQGGEWNALGEFVAVRQYDAHAWAEVWLDGQGWVRVDPTAQVAPERIELGLEAALERNAETAADSPFAGLRGLRNVAALDALMQWFESMEYQWNVWVLGYDGTLQMATLQRWFGQLGIARIAIIFGALVALFLLVLTGAVAWRALLDRTPFAVRRYARVQRLLSALGVPVQAGQTPAQLAAEVRATRPELVDLAGGLLADIERLLYDPDVGRGAEAGALRARVRGALRRLWLRRHLIGGRP